MPELHILDELDHKEKVYTQGMVNVAAFFGGPLAAGYLLIQNYKVFGQQEKVGIAWAIAIIGGCCFFGGGLAINHFLVDIPDFIYGLISLFFARAIFVRDQAVAVAAHLKDGGNKQSGWRVAGVLGVVYALVVVLFLGGFFTLYDLEDWEEEEQEMPVEQEATTGLTSRSYGGMDHMISYDQGQWNAEDVDEIGTALISSGFFGQRRQRLLYMSVEMLPDDAMRWIVWVVETPERAASPQIDAVYERVKEDLGRVFMFEEVNIVLTNEAWEEEYKRF